MNGNGKKTRFRDRSTGDLLVMLVAGTICLMVLTTAGLIVTLEILKPDVDTDRAAAQVWGIVNTLIGLLAGFLAGRTGKVQNGHTPPGDGSFISTNGEPPP